MLRLTAASAVVIVALVLVLVAIGYALPVAHVASRQAPVAATPDEVFSTLVDVERFAEWRTDVTRVEVLARSPLRWREYGSNGEITLVLAASVRPSHLVTRTDDPSLPFGGTWTYDLVPRGSGTAVTITERGEVYNPLFRLMSRFVFGHTATVDTVLTALQGKSGR